MSVPNLTLVCWDRARSNGPATHLDPELFADLASASEAARIVPRTRNAALQTCCLQTPTAGGAVF
jgi:hypothetical protein